LGTGVKADVVRQLVLVEVEGNPPAPQPGGPIEVLLNNTKWDGFREGSNEVAGGAGAQPDGLGDMVTELPRLGATEVWEIMNLTQDAHPIHLHLIQFQLLNRQQIHTSIAPDGSAVYGYRSTYDSKFPAGTYSGQLADGSWGPTAYAAGTYIPGFGPPHDYARPKGAGALTRLPATRLSRPELSAPALLVHTQHRRLELGTMIGVFEPWRLIVVLVSVVMVFGPGNLLELGRAVGDGFRELKRATGDGA